MDLEPDLLRPAGLRGTVQPCTHREFMGIR
jgi:hypothetical protein